MRSEAWVTEPAPVLPGLPCDCTRATLNPLPSVNQAEDRPAGAAVRPSKWRSLWRQVWHGGRAAGRAQKQAALSARTGNATCHKRGAVRCGEQMAGRAGTEEGAHGFQGLSECVCLLRLEGQVTPPGENCDG